MPKDTHELESKQQNVFLIYPHQKGIKDIIDIIRQFFDEYEGESGIQWNIVDADDFRSSIDLLQLITSWVKEGDLAIVILASLRNNVAFELGMIHALQKDYILLVPEGDLDSVKKEFSDISGLKYKLYDPARIFKLKGKLKEELEALAEERKKRIIRQTTPEYLIAIGDSFFQQGLYSEAMLRYKAATDIKGDFYEAWIRLGDSQLQSYDLDAAETSFRKALDLRPQDIVAYEKLGQVLLDSGQYEKAIRESFEPLTSFRPKVTTYYYKIANAFCELGFPEKAVERLHKGIKRMGQVAERAALYYDCAWCCIWKSKRVTDATESEQWIQRALAELKKSIELDPKYEQWAATDQDFDSARSRSDFPNTKNFGERRFSN